jgi:hypothetical protein
MERIVDGKRVKVLKIRLINFNTSINLLMKYPKVDTYFFVCSEARISALANIRN